MALSVAPVRIVLLSITVLVCGVASVPVRAIDDSWSTGSARIIRSMLYDTQKVRRCSDEPITVGTYEPIMTCVYHMDGWRYAIYAHPNPAGALALLEKHFVIGIGHDTKMYVVNGLSVDSLPASASGTDTLVYTICCAPGRTGADLQVYKDLPRLLVKGRGPTGVEYRLTDDAAGPSPRLGADTVYASSLALSGNGRWVAIVAENRGVVRIDLDSMDAVRISDLTARGSFGFTDVSLAITDDGTTVFVGGMVAGNRVLKAYETDACGDTEIGDGPVRKPCRAGDLSEIYAAAAPATAYPKLIQVSHDGRRLTVYSQGHMAIFGRSGSPPVPVDYLALGDSFVSGEGDTEINQATGRKYYADYTDLEGGPGLPTEKCHQSTRSYPYLLTPILGLREGRVRSVACSGAEITDVTGRGTYDGQDRRLTVMAPADIAAAQNDARDLFIPGRVRQIDFVERYSPLTATLAIGGNDSGFASVLAACAYPIPVTTCPYASDPADRRMLGDAIASVYGPLKRAYEDVIAASPGMTLYVSGYPRFVGTHDLDCPLNVNLDPTERRMIDEGVRYINDVIRAAATAAGARYVDVEDVFAGHLLCEDDATAYTNGIALFLGREKAESFHPNARGHAALARSFASFMNGSDAAGRVCDPSGPSDPCVAPLLPAYFGDPSVPAPSIAIPSQLIDAAEWIVGVARAVSATGLLPGSSVRISLHSDPTDLGTYAVDGDGSFTVRLTLPDAIPPGYHTLHVRGLSPSGEPVDMFQVIFVASKGDATIVDLSVSAPLPTEAPEASGSAVALPSSDDIPPDSAGSGSVAAETSLRMHTMFPMMSPIGSHAPPVTEKYYGAKDSSVGSWPAVWLIGLIFTPIVITAAAATVNYRRHTSK